MTGREAVAGLGGTGRLADDLYLMAHHDASGRPYLQPRALGLGLAGALLAELMLADLIGIQPGGVVVPVPGPDTSANQLTGLILRQVAGEHEWHGLRDWLLFLARTAAEEVAGRLGEAGYLARVPARWPGRGARWVPVNGDFAFAPLTRAQAALDPSRPLTVTGAVLAGLAAACGLGPLLQQYAPAGGRRPEQAAERLPPGLPDLIAQTRAAVDSALLAHRV